MLNLNRGLRWDPPLVRTIFVVGERNRGREVQGAHSHVGPGQRHGSSGGSEAAAGDNQGLRLGLKGHCYVDGAGPGHGRARGRGGSACGGDSDGVVGATVQNRARWRPDTELLGRGKAFWNYDQKMRPPPLFK